MSPELIAACTGATIARATIAAKHLAFAMDAYEINTPLRRAMFLANIGHESKRLATTVENLNYKATALLSMFGRHRISVLDANRYGRIDGKQAADQAGIANCIYGGEWGAKNLGNTEPGDGWKFRGNGWMQITGRFNARAITLRLRKKFAELAAPDFEVDPSMLQQPQWAALAAADYIGMKGSNAVADTGNFDAYSDLINIGKKTDIYGDSEGWEDRLVLFSGAKVALRAA